MEFVCVFVHFVCSISDHVCVDGQSVPVWFGPHGISKMDKVFQHLYKILYLHACVRVCVSVVCINVRKGDEIFFFLFVCSFSMAHKVFIPLSILRLSALYCCSSSLRRRKFHLRQRQQQQPKISQLEI